MAAGSGGGGHEGHVHGMDRRRRCHLDEKYATEIAALLAPPSAQSAQEYYDKLMEAKNCHGLRVGNSSERGKGVYATRNFTKEELVLKDQILVGAQHTSNKINCLVCSYCFHFIGSVEHQIGRTLYLQSLVEESEEHLHHHVSSHATEKVFSDRTADSDSISSRTVKERYPLMKDLESLMSGDLSLPYTSNFPLPPIVSCPGGCGEEHYCSQSCANADWESYHSLLCTESGINVKSSRRSALLQFIEHANGTNDIFLVAAKALSFSVLRFQKLKLLKQKNQQASFEKADESTLPLLLEAWKPLAMGFKRRWWDCIALPDDVDVCDEESFRMEIRDLAYTSLQLLKDVIFDVDCAPLFSLEIYGHIIGMFELNNLDLVVASPVEDYFIFIDDLPDAKKEEAQRMTRPFLDALGDDYFACCQGTAFFPIQSCMNHSCLPNAKAFKRDEDKDGNAVIIALRPITAGEEITISYIDEDLTYEERQAALRDYGFRCSCSKCLQQMPSV